MRSGKSYQPPTLSLFHPVWKKAWECTSFAVTSLSLTPKLAQKVSKGCSLSPFWRGLPEVETRLWSTKEWEGSALFWYRAYATRGFPYGPPLVGARAAAVPFSCHAVRCELMSSTVVELSYKPEGLMERAIILVHQREGRTSLYASVFLHQNARMCIPQVDARRLLHIQFFCTSCISPVNMKEPGSHHSRNKKTTTLTLSEDVLIVLCYCSNTVFIYNQF